MKNKILHYEVRIERVKNAAYSGHLKNNNAPDFLIKEIKKVKNPHEHLHFIFVTIDNRTIYVLKSDVREMEVSPIYKEG